jgi:hypothetical protein
MHLLLYAGLGVGVLLWVKSHTWWLPELEMAAGDLLALTTRWVLRLQSLLLVVIRGFGLRVLCDGWGASLGGA